MTETLYGSITPLWRKSVTVLVHLQQAANGDKMRKNRAAKSPSGHAMKMRTKNHTIAHSHWSAMFESQLHVECVEVGEDLNSDLYIKLS